MDSWLVDVLTSTAPSVSKIIISIYDKLKGMNSEEANRVITILLLAQIMEQNNIVLRKIDYINENIAILLERTKKS